MTKNDEKEHGHIFTDIYYINKHLGIIPLFFQTAS